MFLMRACFLFLVAVAGLCAFPSDAQNYARIDALKNQLAGLQGLAKAQMLNQLSFEYRMAYPDSTLFYGEQALTLATEVGDAHAQAQSLNFLGLGHFYKSNYVQASTLYNRALALAVEHNDSLQMGHAYNNLGRLFFESASLKKAFENFREAQVIFENLGDAEGQAYVYRSLSDLYESQKDFTNALQMAQRAVSIRRVLNEPRSVAAALAQEGKIHQFMGNYLEAEKTLREAESLASETEDEASLAEIKIGLARLYLGNGSLSKAMTEAFRAENILVRLDNPVLTGTAYLLLGQVFLQQKNLTEAARYLEQALAQAERFRQLETLTEANFYLAQVYGLSGKQEKATYHQARYRLLSDSLTHRELAAMAEKFNYQLAIERGTRENEVLKATEAKNETTILLQRSLLAATALGLFTIGLFSYFLWRGSQARKRMNWQLARQNRQLTQLNEEKDALMGMVAHDLKTPLMNISSLSDLVGGTPSEQQEKFLGLIRSSSQSGLELINELLDVHAIESAQHPTRQPVDTHVFMQERVRQFEATARAKDITLQSVLGAGTAVTDAAWITRVVDNLLSNAIKYSPAHTTVQLDSEVAGGQWRMCVVDQGLGFTEEDRQKLFQKFKKLSARPTAGESSSGLGLSIVKVLIDRLGGTIELQTEKGKGSRFTVLIPVSVGAIPGA